MNGSVRTQNLKKVKMCDRMFLAKRYIGPLGHNRKATEVPLRGFSFRLVVIFEISI